MRKILWIITTLAVAVAACLVGTDGFAAPLPGKRIIKASGNIVTREIPIPEFDAINTSRAVKVILAEQGDKIRIDADDNVMEWVIVESEEGELQVTIDRRIKSINNIHVTVTIPVQGRTFRALRASSAAEIHGSQVELTGKDLLVKASSAAEIEASVKAGSCSIDASSAADVDLTVEAATCNIEASSAAEVRAQIKSRSCTASASSAAGITLRRQMAGAGRGPISRSGIPAHLTASIPHRKAFVYNIFSRGLFPPPGGVLAVARRGKNCYTDGTDTAAPPSRRADGPLLRVCPF